MEQRYFIYPDNAGAEVFNWFASAGASIEWQEDGYRLLTLSLPETPPDGTRKGMAK